MLSAAAAERNKEPVLAVLRENVSTGRPLRALEISSGTGQHVTHFAQALRNIIWQPSEYDRQSLDRYRSAVVVLYYDIYGNNPFASNKRDATHL